MVLRVRMEVTLTISDETYEKLRTRSKKQGFDEPEKYGELILDVVLSELEPSGDSSVEDRLQDLGYLD